jgi:uroporphyrinogen-III synthase
MTAALPLTGKTIALAEARQLEELAQMLEKEGATALRCPMFSILDNPDTGPVLSWLNDLAAGRFQLIVLMTGEALRRLIGFADRAGTRQAVVEALGRTRVLTRGPKPVRALKEIDLAPALVAQQPTTEGVINTLRSEQLRGQTVGVTLYGEPNPPLVQFLESAGAAVKTVMPYVYAPASDADRVASLIRDMERGKVAALVFTSSAQVDRLYEVAQEQRLEAELGWGLERTSIAAVGPVVAENLRERKARVDICPEQGFVMKNLVAQIRKTLGANS